MLYVATVHYQAPRWIEIQTRHLREHISVPMQIWSSLEHIDPSHGRHFDRILDQRGSHAGKLNHMANEIGQEAQDEDLIMFMDGDAFPIADPMPLVQDALSRNALVAVRRAENVDEPQPHPCFCVTTMGLWRSLPGDWTAGPTWPGARGVPTTDVGGNLWRRLVLTDTPWQEILRSNRRNIDPLYFAIYGDIVYHHGAGFRAGELSPVDRDHAPEPLALPDSRLARPAVKLLNRARWHRWETGLQKHHVAESQRIYEQIQRREPGWLDQFR